MSIYPYVSPGDKVTPSARLENDIRSVVNNFLSLNEITHSGKAQNKISIPIYNSTSETLLAGSTVEIETDNTYDLRILSFPAKIASKNSKFWGIIEQTIAPGETGDLVVGGLTTINQILMTGYYSPDGNGGFTKDINGKGIAFSMYSFFLGMGGSETQTDTFGYFSMSCEIKGVNWIWTCYDSANPDSGIAGYVCVGAERIAVPVNTFYNPKDCSVYVKIVMDSDKPNEVTGMSYSYHAVLTTGADDVYGVEYIKIGRFVHISGYESKFYREADLKIVGYV